MKKRFWSLFLCLVLVCSSLAGCGSKDVEDEEKAAAEAKSVISDQLKEFADNVTEAMQNKPAASSTSLGTGVELDLSFAPSEWVRRTFALDGMETVSLLLTADIKEALAHLTGKLSLNGTGTFSMDVIADSEMLYANLPAYSKLYMGMTLEEAIGLNPGELSELVLAQDYLSATMPSYDEFCEIWTDFADNLIECFEYQETVKNISFGDGDYRIKADKYITQADPEALAEVFAELNSKLAEYPEFSDADIEFDPNGIEKLTLNYFVNSDGEFAWEVEASTGSEKVSGVLISAKKGFQLYAQDGDLKRIFAFSSKESDTKGKIVFCDTPYGDFTINYDNYTKDHVDISIDFVDVQLSLNIDTAENLTIEYEILVAGIKIYGTLTADSNNMTLTVSFYTMGNELGTFTIDAKKRSARSFKVPESYLDPESWDKNFDQEKLEKDIKQLKETYPFLNEILGDLE